MLPVSGFRKARKVPTEVAFISPLVPHSFKDSFMACSDCHLAPKQCLLPAGVMNDKDRDSPYITYFIYSTEIMIHRCRHLWQGVFGLGWRFVQTKSMIRGSTRDHFRSHMSLFTTTSHRETDAWGSPLFMSLHRTWSGFGSLSSLCSHTVISLVVFKYLIPTLSLAGPLVLCP